MLGALVLLARSLRLPRVPATMLALAGLALFVLLVGPDASVLRAALMGSIALASLAGGRTGRGLSFLCLAVIGLLLTDPDLGTSFGFLLSVLATLGIIVIGQRLVDLTPADVPRWVAAAFAVPLSAQLLCGPVIVLLQPQFSTYSLLANVMAAPLVAPGNASWHSRGSPDCPCTVGCHGPDRRGRNFLWRRGRDGPAHGGPARRLTSLAGRGFRAGHHGGFVRA